MFVINNDDSDFKLLNLDYSVQDSKTEAETGVKTLLQSQL